MKEVGTKTKPTQGKPESSSIERWVTRGFSDHWVIIEVDGEPCAAKFQSYGLTLDVSKEHDKKVSDALRASSRFGRDIFVVRDEPYLENEIGKQAGMLRTLREMTIPQLRQLVTMDELIESGIPTNTQESDDFIALIIRKKSLETE